MEAIKLDKCLKNTEQGAQNAITNIQSIHKPALGKTSGVALFCSKVSAGFPSPADDYMEGKLDLNEYLVKQPAATFFVRCTGDSMINAGIAEGDILVVDRSLTPISGKIVVAVLNGELTVKRLYKHEEYLELLPENPNYHPIRVNKEHDFMVWGVVTSVIHKV